MHRRKEKNEKGKKENIQREREREIKRRDRANDREKR